MGGNDELAIAVAFSKPKSRLVEPSNAVDAKLMVEEKSTQMGVLDGKYDDLPEQSFYVVGGIEEVIAKADKIAKESVA
ncbi:hypothetical protein COLO4_13012 [Corchorus olitorius]|uniref:Uncharacterized protein n=1 Tax=Corchorus olitorius TaxID=93759 RepID=A0A1R3JYP8_9ROSI|nr:hypothetical protein COLO4_13012 [Corchorus olitorius]